MTDHPCKGMTPAQKRDFELIAIGQRPRGGHMTINKLKAAGLIADAPPKIVGRDRFGDVIIPVWYVPLSIHCQWCEWCSEQPENIEPDGPNDDRMGESPRRSINLKQI